MSPLGLADFGLDDSSEIDAACQTQSALYKINNSNPDQMSLNIDQRTKETHI